MAVRKTRKVTTKKKPTSKGGGSTKKQATTLSPTKTRKQLNKEKADMIRAGYGAKQPTARGARKAKRATKKMGKMAKSVGSRATGGFSCSKGKASNSACGKKAVLAGFSTVNKKSRKAKKATR